MLGETHWLKLPSLARYHRNHLRELFNDRRSWSGTELTSHHQPGKVKRRHHVSDHFPESSLLASILTEQRWATRKDQELEWLARDNPESNPVTIKPKTVSHLAVQVSWIPLPSSSLPRHPFPIKSLAFSAPVSPQTIHFLVLDKSPLSGAGKGPPSCNRKRSDHPLLWCITLFAHPLGVVSG